MHSQTKATYTGRELIGDEALEPLELGLLLGRGDGAAVGRLRVEPAEAAIPALHHRQNVALLVSRYSEMSREFTAIATALD